MDGFCREHYRQGQEGSSNMYTISGRNLEVQDDNKKLFILVDFFLSIKLPPSLLQPKAAATDALKFRVRSLAEGKGFQPDDLMPSSLPAPHPQVSPL